MSKANLFFVKELVVDSGEFRRPQSLFRIHFKLMSFKNKN